jgi:GMP synthase (glutamine-hydrolysing)
MTTEKKKTIVIFSHGTTVRLGAIQSALSKANLLWTVIELHKEDKVPENVDTFDGVILMGGPMSAYQIEEFPWLRDEMAYVESMIQANKPVFGICLGCQMLAGMHKGEVFAGDKGFCVGFRHLYIHEPDETFGAELKGLNGFSWHGDTYKLGEGSDRLITGSFYHEQGVKFAKNVYGVQFHPEVTKEMVQAWYMRDIQNDCLPECAKPLHETLKEAEEHLLPVHVWLEKFIARLFTA